VACHAHRGSSIAALAIAKRFDEPDSIITLVLPQN